MSFLASVSSVPSVVNLFSSPIYSLRSLPRVLVALWVLFFLSGLLLSRFINLAPFANTPSNRSNVGSISIIRTIKANKRYNRKWWIEN